MKKKNMTKDELKTLIATLNTEDRDSFASFTNGLRSNWIFLIAVFGIAMWIFNQFSTSVTTNNRQDFEISANSQAIAELTTTVNALASQQQTSITSSNEVRQDIALIKADIATIKESLK